MQKLWAFAICGLAGGPLPALAAGSVSDAVPIVQVQLSAARPSVHGVVPSELPTPTPGSSAATRNVIGDASAAGLLGSSGAVRHVIDDASASGIATSSGAVRRLIDPSATGTNLIARAPSAAAGLLPTSMATAKGVLEAPAESPVGR